MRASASTSFRLALFVLVGGFWSPMAFGQAPDPATPAPPPGAQPGARPPHSGETIEVEADGEGMSEEQAIRIALRSALEKAGKNEIFSETHVQDFQLMHDTIIARAEGIVTDYKVTDKKSGLGGTTKVRIKARVSKKSLVDSWGAIQNVLHQIGRPKILVWINEQIDHQPQESSQLEVLLEKKLIDSGFDMVARQAIEVSKARELDDAAGANNVSKLQAIAKSFDAEIFVAGTSNANASGVREVYGEPLAMYNCDAQLKIYYTDSGKLLASEGFPNDQVNGRGGAQGIKEHSPQAGRKALANVARPMIDSLYHQIMKQWSTQITAGGEIILEVQKMRFKSANDLKRALQEVEGINAVNMNFAHQVATYRINGRMSAQDLAEKLSGGPFSKFLEVSDLKLNRIQATAAEPAPASQP